MQGFKYFPEEGEPCSPADQGRPELDPSCESNSTYCPILKNQCRSGLICPATGPGALKCSYPPGGGGDDEITKSCFHKKQLYNNGELHWNPSCEPDGTFSPKQCKGTLNEGFCYCADSEGRRIFGREWANKAGNMTCGTNFI